MSRNWHLSQNIYSFDLLQCKFEFRVVGLNMKPSQLKPKVGCLSSLQCISSQKYQYWKLKGVEEY